MLNFQSCNSHMAQIKKKKIKLTMSVTDYMEYNFLLSGINRKNIISKTNFINCRFLLHELQFVKFLRILKNN